MISPKCCLVLILTCAILRAGPSRAQTPTDPNQRTVDVTGHAAKPERKVVSFATLPHEFGFSAEVTVIL